MTQVPQHPVFVVDFNEMLEGDLVLLSKDDIRLDAAGNPITLFAGMKITISEEDTDFEGSRDDLVAHGVVERNNVEAGWSSDVKWCCRINKDGIRHKSEL